MTAYSSTKVASTVQPRAGIDITAAFGTYTVSVNPAAGDTFDLCKIPAGATVLEVIVSTDATLGATSTASIGDTGSSTRFATAATFGQGAATLTRTTVAAGVGYTYSADDKLRVTLATNGTPATGAVIRGVVIYTMQS